MIRSFADAGTEAVFNGPNSGPARRQCPRGLWTVARRKLDQLDSAERLEDLRVRPGNHLEALARDRKGQHSVRINDQFRVCFRWIAEGPADVEIVGYHDGRRKR